jgi:hypothetical protein
MKRTITIIGVAIFVLLHVWFATVEAQRATTHAANVEVLGTRLNITNATDPYFDVIDSTNSVQTKLQSTDTTGWVGTVSNHDFYLRSNNVIEMTIEADGDIGIGTTSPVAGLNGVVTNGLFLWEDTEAHNTAKYGRWGIEHYDINQEPLIALYMASDNGASALRIGGGTVVGNAVETIYFYTAADDVTTTGTSRMVIDSNGDVRIGNGAAADELLHIENTTVDGTAGIAIETDANKWVLDVIADESLQILDGATVVVDIDDGADAGSVHLTSSEVVFNEGSADHDFRVESDTVTSALFVQGSDGNVGIGTSTPDVGLHGVVTGGLMLWEDTDADDTNKWGQLGIQVYDTTDSEQPFYGVVHNVTATQNILRLGGGVSSGNAATDITFYTATGVDTQVGTLRATFDNAGGLGIGTAAPDGTISLHVFSGDASQTADANADEGVFENSTVSGISILSGTTSTGNIYFGDADSDNIGIILYSHNDNDMGIYVDGDQVLYLTSDNYETTLAGVGIGIAPPANSRFAIDLTTENLAYVDAGSAAATEQDWIEVTVGGNQGYIRVYAAK